MALQAGYGRRYMFAGVAVLVLIFIYAAQTSIRSRGLSIQIVHTGERLDNAHMGDAGASGVTIKTKVAAIVENRPLDQAVPLLLHFATVLGPEWPIVLFTTREDIPDSAPLQRLIDERRFEIRALPSETSFKTRKDVSVFLTKPWMYEQLAPAGHVLLFQTDSILCSRSNLSVDDFLEYDFVGAPIAERYGKGYNGGLSLRNRTMVLDIIKKADLEAELKAKKKPKKKPNEKPKKHSAGQKRSTIEFEDQWFYAKMLKYPGSRLPTVDVAKTFAVETIWYDTPLGYHQIARWQKERLPEVDKWCPEHTMASSEVIHV